MALASRLFLTRLRTCRSSRAIRSRDETSAFACLRAKSSRCRWSLRYVLAKTCQALCQFADWRGRAVAGWLKGADGAGGVDGIGTGCWVERSPGEMAGGYVLCLARWRAA